MSISSQLGACILCCFASLTCVAQDVPSPRKVITAKQTSLVHLLRLVNAQPSCTLEQLLAGDDPSIVRSARESSSNVYRIWTFGGWGSSLNTLFVKNGKITAAKRISQSERFKPKHALIAGDFAQQMLQFFEKAMCDPVPFLHPTDGVVTLEADSSCYIIERANEAGEYSWAVRSANITQKAATEESIMFLNKLAGVEWR